MAPTPTYTVPDKIRAGDTLQFLVAGGDTPSSAYTGSAAMYGPATIAGTVTAQGDDYLVTFTATATAAGAAGDYRWAVMATSGATRYTIAEGTIRLDVNAGTITGTSGLEHCQRTLTLIETAIEGRLTSDMESYSIGGRSISKIPMRELVRLRGIYRTKVRMLQTGGRPLPGYQVQFVPPGPGVGS